MNSLNIPDSKLPRLIIIGGGFGGLKLLRKLVRHHRFQIILIDKRNYHTFQPLLYQVASAGLDVSAIAYPLRKTVREKTPDAFFRMGEAKYIDTELKTVFLDIGQIDYDYLVLATGTKTNFFGNKEIERKAMRMKSVPQAVNIRSLVLENLEEATITKDPKKRQALLNFVIAGGGPTGVELSGAIAELRKNVVPRDYIDIDPKEIQIQLIEGQDRLLASMSEKASKNAKKALEKLGVQLHLNTRVESYDGKNIRTANGKEIEAETFVWSAGVTGAPVLGLKEQVLVEKANRYKVNAHNRVEGYPNIFAIGDIALMQNEKFPKGHPMVAQPAIQQGKHLAKNLLRLLDGKELKPFKYVDKGSLATIGRNKAVADLKVGHFSGFIAWILWMAVHLWFLVGFKNRVGTFLSWTYRYINYDRSNRLIVRPFKEHPERLEDEE